MITYVNTVFVDNVGGSNQVVVTINKANAGKFVILNAETGTLTNTPSATGLDKIKIGLIDANGKVKWSNTIKKDCVKHFSTGKYTANTPETVVVTATADSNAIIAAGKGEKRILIRITYKDLPTRFRKWTDTYEYVAAEGETFNTNVLTKLADIINNDKRSRVTATASGYSLTLTAKEYDDNDDVDTINEDAHVRFNVNVYYTDPEAHGFASKNKYAVPGLSIVKTPATIYPAYWKIVRDREAQAMGYDGILNRGEGTWPIIKPAMKVDPSVQYDYCTLEFENDYRAADDVFRKTKQTVEIYSKRGETQALISFLDNWTRNNTVVQGTTN